MHRLGSFCARHRFLVLVVWLVVAVGIIAIVSQVGAKTNNNLSLPGTDSQRATDLLAGKFPPRQNASSPIVFHLQSGVVTDPKPKARSKPSVGLSVAVALAGTMMLLLAPSILVLFGRTTWWLPRWLGFLPQINVEGGAKLATIAGGSGLPVDGSSDEPAQEPS